MYRKKLSIEDQISHMKGKGIQFNLVSEDQAKEFLAKNTYYFKLKAYAKNYDKYATTERNGRYINLEFAYLQELSTLDMHFRRFIIETCLNLEHALKVRLLRDLSGQKDEDGYQIVNDFFTAYPGIKEELREKKKASVCRDLITKYENDFALWNIVEVLSFGDFINLYRFYYDKYEDTSSLSNMIFPIKLLRNAAAHNNCLLNSLAKPYAMEIKKNNKLARFISGIPDIGSREMQNKLSNLVIHDFMLLLYIFDQIVESKGIKQNTYENLKTLVDQRVIRNKEYFEKNQALSSSYKFLKKVVDFFASNAI